MDKKKIIQLAIWSEGILFCLWLAGSFFNLVQPRLYPSLESIEILSYLVVSLGVLVFANYILFFRTRNVQRRLFREHYLQPLCDLLDFKSAILISILAGIGEELFFRDFVLNFLAVHTNDWLALIISSSLFAFLHFIGKSRELFGILLIYFLVGIFIGSLYLQTDSVLFCILLHSLYDFVAIIMYQRWPKVS